MFAAAAGFRTAPAICVSNRQFECSSTALGELTDSKRTPLLRKGGSETMKMDAYAEIFLWNQNVDRLVRVLQRLESCSIRSNQGIKVYEVRLEEIRAGLNADFAQAMAALERSDKTHLRLQR